MKISSVINNAHPSPCWILYLVGWLNCVLRLFYLVLKLRAKVIRIVNHTFKLAKTSGFLIGRISRLLNYVPPAKAQSKLIQPLPHYFVYTWFLPSLFVFPLFPLFSFFLLVSLLLFPRSHQISSNIPFLVSETFLVWKVFTASTTRTLMPSLKHLSIYNINHPLLGLHHKRL